jgi:hypothetical protein
MLFSGSVKDDLLDADGTTLYIPMNSEEQRNPKKEDAYLVYKLIEHLNSNLEHYNKVLWYNLDPDRRYMLLDGFNIQILNDFGLPFDKYGEPLPPRSLASVVKNDLITVTGNSLVFPVAAGYKVSQDYIILEEPEDETDIEEPQGEKKKKKRITLLDHYQPLTPIQPYRISVPSKGVFAEAIQGACNACEKIERDRLQDWNKFPNTDEPTVISPVTPPAVAITDWQAAFKERPGVILNISSAGGLRGGPALGVYNLTKAALVMFTRQLASEIGPSRVVGLAPGLVETDFAGVLVENFGEAMAKRNPTRRLGQPQDVASFACFLVSDAASWITGDTFLMDGGSGLVGMA